MVLVRRRRAQRAKRRPLIRKRRMNISRPLSRYHQGKVYAFKRTCALPAWYYANGAWTQASSNEITNSTAFSLSSGIFKFKLSDLPGYTDFTNMYEQFKISGVKLQFMPTIGTEASASNFTGVVCEPIAFAIDRGANDQLVAGPSFNSLMENQDVKLRNSQKPFTMWIGTPTYHQPADGATQVSYKSGWLDTELSGSYNVDFHGLKYSFPGTRSETNAVWYRVYATYYIKCRNPQ